MRVHTSALAPRIRAYLDRTGLTQAQLAERIGVSPVVINRCLTGSRKTVQADQANQILQVVDRSDADDVVIRPEPRTPAAPTQPEGAAAPLRVSKARVVLGAQSDDGTFELPPPQQASDASTPKLWLDPATDAGALSSPRSRLAARSTARWAGLSGRSRTLDQLEKSLTAADRPSVVLVGSAGVGKTSSLRRLLDLRTDDGPARSVARPRLALGPPVRGADFFGRSRDLDLLRTSIDKGSVVLLGPRRSGKTSLLMRLADSAAADEIVRYLSVAHLGDEAELFARIAEELAAVETPNRLESLDVRLAPMLGDEFLASELSGRGILERLGREDWRDLGEETLATLSAWDRRAVIVLDELPAFLETLEAAGPDRLRSFLLWFREVRSRFPEVRFVLSGSTGLDPMLERLGFSATCNDFTRLELPPMSREEAGEMIEQLAAGSGASIAEDVRELMMDRLGELVPFVVQLALSEAIRLSSLPGAKPAMEIDEACVNGAVDALIEQSGSPYFRHWAARLDHRSTPEASRLTHQVLNAVSKEEAGLRIDELDASADPQALSAAISRLVREGYLSRVGDRVRFRSRVLRLWWSRWEDFEPSSVE